MTWRVHHRQKNAWSNGEDAINIQRAKDIHLTNTSPPYPSPDQTTVPKGVGFGYGEKEKELKTRMGELKTSIRRQVFMKTLTCMYSGSYKYLIRLCWEA